LIDRQFPVNRIEGGMMEWKDAPQWISAFAATVSACGVFFAFFQLLYMQRMADTQFADAMDREYRKLVGRLPTKALLGQELTEEEHKQYLDEFIHYTDLSNEQVYLRQRKRVSLPTWQYWCDGIRSNVNRPAFARAWAEVKAGTENFAELRRLEADGLRGDPSRWT
jgi:hypothetical protein